MGYSHGLGALANIRAELKVFLILALNTPSVQAAKKATVTIPIVMTQIADPLKSGLVTSLSRPGGNVTGMSFKVDELTGKGLALLKEAFPSLSRVAVPGTCPTPRQTLPLAQLKLRAESSALSSCSCQCVVKPTSSRPSRLRAAVGLKRSLSSQM